MPKKPVDIEKLNQLFLEGLSQQELADFFGVGTDCIRRNLRLLGLSQPKKWGHSLNNKIKRQKLYLEKCNYVAKLIEQGCSNSQICKRVDMKSRDLICRIKKQRFPHLVYRRAKLIDWEQKPKEKDYADTSKTRNNFSRIPDRTEHQNPKSIYRDIREQLKESFTDF